MEKENEKKIWKKISSGKKSHNRVPPQQFACDWIRSKKVLTIGYQDTNRVQTLMVFDSCDIPYLTAVGGVPRILWTNPFAVSTTLFACGWVEAFFGHRNCNVSPLVFCWRGGYMRWTGQSLPVGRKGVVCGPIQVFFEWGGFKNVEDYSLVN